MKTEAVFKEILKSPELHLVFKIPTEDIKNITLHNDSNYPVIEIIKAILKGQEKHSSKDQIFQVIQRQIMQL